ncbi:tetratricopeptide repeat protein [Burkholderia glumae]|uniref:tetratricopeptide repeat protein n=1 Tax=Burkholderia glumae TaxID=337 RepID=UPI00214F663D|nr:tetratricopeptide repeat protein [Burkholderia glumae]
MSFQEDIDRCIKERKLYFLGEELPSDWYAGFNVWLPLAQNGDVKAMYNVGTCLVRGDGTDQDVAEGTDWYRRAAEKGDPRAMFALYERLKTLAPAEANGFLTSAATAGEPRALAVIREVEQEQQTAQDRDRQQKLANYEAAVVADVRQSIERGDRAAAIKVAEQAVADGLTWAGGIIAALSLKVSVERSARKRHTLIQGASTTVKVASGVYHTAPVVTTLKDYTFNGRATNPTTHPVTMYFNERGSTYTRSIEAGGTVNIARGETAEKQWPSQVEIHLNDPAKSRIKMTLGHDQVAMSTGFEGFGWKALLAVGAVIVALVFLRALTLH